MKSKVFISGNQTEFREERRATKDFIINDPTLNHLFNVFLFEDLPAKGKSPSSVYLEEVGSSEIYIGIIGNNYGSTDSKGLSHTEREFEEFCKNKSPEGVLIFIKGNDDSQRDQKTQKFISKIKNFTYTRFTDQEDLINKVRDGLISFIGDRLEKTDKPFDERIRTDSRYSDISEKEVIDFLAKRTIKTDAKIPATSVEDVLLNRLNVLKDVEGELKPTNAALLFFSQYASDFIPQNEIRIARYKGSSRGAHNTIDQQEINGPIYHMIEGVEKFFKRNTRLANKIIEFKRVEIPEYPYEAIREALINAIAHRDYDIEGTPIMISIFDDRVEILSPGSLLPGMKINEIEGQHRARNRKICDIFHQTRDMERFGTGISKMKELMEDHGLSEPKFYEKGDAFVVQFYGPGENILDLVSNIPEDRKIDLKELGLEKRQIEALIMMVNEEVVFTNTLYREIFGVSKSTAVRDLNALVNSKQVVKIGKVRGTKYKATTEMTRKTGK